MHKILALVVGIDTLRKSFNILWQAVQDGKINSRGIVGDELLNMKDAFDELDHHLRK